MQNSNCKLSIFEPEIMTQDIFDTVYISSIKFFIPFISSWTYFSHSLHQKQMMVIDHCCVCLTHFFQPRFSFPIMHLLYVKMDCGIDADYWFLNCVLLCSVCIIFYETWNVLQASIFHISVRLWSSALSIRNYSLFFLPNS